MHAPTERDFVNGGPTLENLKIIPEKSCGFFSMNELWEPSYLVPPR